MARLDGKKENSTAARAAWWNRETGEFQPFFEYTGTPEQQLIQAHQWQYQHDHEASAREYSRRWLVERGISV